MAEGVSEKGKIGNSFSISPIPGLTRRNRRGGNERRLVVLEVQVEAALGNLHDGTGGVILRGHRESTRDDVLHRVEAGDGELPQRVGARVVVEPGPRPQVVVLAIAGGEQPPVMAGSWLSTNVPTRRMSGKKKVTPQSSSIETRLKLMPSEKP